ncbi:MFS transporter [Bacillus salitolerans]|uniref:MFS transporter n=1 Tax=Bacillus salitolerans TaxID=1437434 RepID=A0ABW4LJ20_9BACI
MGSTPKQQTARYHLISFLLIFMGLFVACNIYTLIPLYPIISLEWSTPITSIVGGSTSFMFCYAVGLLLFGPISDQWGRKTVIVIGMLLFSITSLFVAFSEQPSTLLVTRGIQGFAGGTFAPVAFAYTFELFEGKYRTLVLALINTGFLVAGIIGQLISSTLANLLGWPSVFYFFSIVYFLLFVSSFLILPSRPRNSRNGPFVPVSEFILFIKNQSLRYSYMIAFSLLLTFVTFYDTLGAHLAGQVTPNQLFVIRSAGLIGTILSLYGGRVIHKIRLKGSLLVGLIMLIVSLTAFMIFSSFLPILFVSILLVAAISLLLPTIIMLIGILGNAARGSAISLYSFTLLTGACLGSLLTSLLAFKFVILTLLLLSIVNLLLIRKISFPIEP